MERDPDDVTQIASDAFDRTEKLIGPYRERIAYLEKRLTTAENICDFMEGYINYFDCDHCIYTVNQMSETVHEDNCELMEAFNAWKQIRSEGQ